MGSRNKKNSTTNVQATRSLRSKGPAIGVRDILLADSARSGQPRAVASQDPTAVDARRSLEVTTMPEQPAETTDKTIHKIIIRPRGKGRAAQPPLITEAPTQATGTLKEPGAGNVDHIMVSKDPLTTMETEDSELEEIPFSPRKRPAPRSPPTKSEFGLTRLSKYIKYIAGRGEPIDKPVTDVSGALLHRLEVAEKTRGGPRAVRNKLLKIAHEEFVQQRSLVFRDSDEDHESGVEPQDDIGDGYSPNLLECARRVMIVEARIQESSDAKNLAHKNQRQWPLKRRTPRDTPPGGVLGVDNVSGEGIPPMATLRIDQYSNATYWQFAPYLEPEFRTDLEELYRPNNQGLYDIEVDDLESIRESQERRVVMKVLAVSSDKPSLRLAQDDEAMEGTATTHTSGQWELSIMDHLISHCDAGGLGPIDKENSTDTGSDFEDSELGYDEDEPALVAKSKKEKRRRKEKNDSAVVCSSDEGDTNGKGETPRYIKRVKLSEEDRKVAVDLWDEVINPACLAFEERTGKPAEAMREAIAGVIARRVNQRSRWNTWQKVWWSRFPKVQGKALRKELRAQCHETYQSKISELGTRASIDSWTRELEEDLAERIDHDTRRNAAAKILDIQNELLSTSQRAARDHIHVLFFALLVNPYSLHAQSMSGFGVGSKEMRSVLVDNDQLLRLHLILNDLKTKVANLELENRKAGILPPAYGDGSLLQLEEYTGSKRSNPPTKYELFNRETVTGISDSIPAGQARSRAASRPHKKLRGNDGVNENDIDFSTANTVAHLPPLPASEALVEAVSHVQLPEEGWAPRHVFQLFAVLVNPPPNLDLDVVEGLNDYLYRLMAEIGNLVENGARVIAIRCWRVLMRLCSSSSTLPNRAVWAPILNMLKKAKKRLVNWCPSVNLPTDGPFPKSRQTYRNMATMFFHPNSAHRLRLVPIEGPITDDTPIIINRVVQGTVCQGCTVAGEIVPVDPSIVSQWHQPLGATRGLDPTPQSVAATTMTAPATTHTITPRVTLSSVPHSNTSVELLPMTQRLEVPPPTPLPSGVDIPIGPSHFELPGTSYPFSPFATLGSTFIPPSDIFDPHHAGRYLTTVTATAQDVDSRLASTSQKRVHQPVPMHEERRKRQKLETGDKHRPVGGREVTRHSVAITDNPTEVNTSNRSPLISVPSIARPEGMSTDEWVKWLQAEIVAQLDGSALDK